MEIFIWQNFAKIFFNDFTAFFSTATKTGLLGAFNRKIKEIGSGKLRQDLTPRLEIENQIKA